MPLRKLKAKVQEAKVRVDALVREGRACNCVLVVHDHAEAATNIYFEEEREKPPASAPRLVPGSGD